MNNAQKKAYLSDQLQKTNSFWSYEKDSVRAISDWNFIKFVLIRLDLDDIDILFDLFPKKMIKKVWLKELVAQGDYLKNMNLCFALVYFGIKNPVRYLKSMETKIMNAYGQVIG